MLKDIVRCAAIAAVVVTGLGACFSGTTVPGLKRCVRVFIVIGYYSECEEGPPWAAAPQPASGLAPNRPPLIPPAGNLNGSFCFYAIPENAQHAVETCFDTIDECRRVQGIVKPPATITIECQTRDR